MAVSFARINTVALVGTEVVEDVGVEVQFSSGTPGISIVGLPSKLVSGSRDRDRGGAGDARPCPWVWQLPSLLRGLL